MPSDVAAGSLVCSRSSYRCSSWGTSTERRSKQIVDLVTSVGAGQALVELDLDEANEERIERAAGGKQLLGHLRKRPSGCDHAGQRRNLASSTLNVADGGLPLVDERAHDDTKAAPVIPEAA